MRSHRRLALIRRAVPYLASAVGLFALLGAVLVDMESQQRATQLNLSLAALRAGLDRLNATVAAPSPDPEAAAAARRIDALEARIGELEAAAAAVPVVPASADGLMSPAGDSAAAPIDPDLPTTDCIPTGTRFMATPNTEYPMCQSTLVIKVGAITADTVSIAGVGEVVEATFAQLPDGKCSVMVFTADVEGFGELRVSCN